MVHVRVAAFAILLALSFTRLALAQAVVPRFETGSCPFSAGPWAGNVRLECGQLVVWQIRDRPAAGTLRLAVAIVHPLTPPSAPPLVLLHGGPSGPGALNGGAMNIAARWTPALSRDIVVYDQRGVGSSEPQLCPSPDGDGGRRANLPTLQERQAAWLEEARRCVATMKSHGLETSAFATPANAADAIDLRKTLGYRSWDLYGVSYGSRLAQEIMRRDPDGVRSAVLVSPVLPGPAVQAEAPLAFERTLDRVFAACGAQASCASAFPSLEKDFYDLYDELTAKPIDVVIDSRASSSVAVHFDGDRMVRALRNGFPRRVARVPLFIHELRHGDRLRAARLLLGNSAAAAGDNTMTNLVTCYDVGGVDVFRTTLAPILAKVRPPFRAIREESAECTAWQDRFADPSERALVRSAIPTLIVTMEFDNLTPPDDGHRIAAGLEHAFVIELPGFAHAQPLTRCPESIVFRFWETPSGRLDTSCIATMPKLAFGTTRLEE